MHLSLIRVEYFGHFRQTPPSLVKPSSQTHFPFQTSLILQVQIQSFRSLMNPGLHKHYPSLKN